MKKEFENMTPETSAEFSKKEMKEVAGGFISLCPNCDKGGLQNEVRDDGTWAICPHCGYEYHWSDKKLVGG